MTIYLKAYQAYRQQNYDQCMRLLQEIKPNDTKRLDLLAQIHFQKKEFQKAYDIYQDLLERETEFVEERQENVQTLIACAQLEQPGTLVVKPGDCLPTASEIVDQVQQINLRDESAVEQENSKRKHNKNKKRKRPVRLPKQYDPCVLPDPERWLPRKDRKGNAHRQKRRRPRPNVKGSAGGSGIGNKPRANQTRNAMASKLSMLLVALLACTTFFAGLADCYGVMSVDLGSEWMKVGLVASNAPMDLVLNDQSNRKTSMAIAISNGERFVGDSALDVAIKYPERTYTYFLDLVGKSIDDNSVKQYKQKFPYANISSHEPNSTSIILNHPQGNSFTPLELVAMMLQLAQDQVVNRVGEPITDVVFTVPPFFNSIEKKVIRDAARVVGLNTLRFTPSNAAFALSYGIFRHKDYLPEESDNKTSIIFFDQGASQTSVTVADYHLIEQIDPVTFDSRNESLPTVTIRAQVYDRFLGGLDMQLRLRDKLVETFAKETKIDPARIFNRGRSASKVLKEAGRVKRVLSANTDFLVRIENVIDDKDLRFPITRKYFEEMNEDLLEGRVKQLLDSLFELPNVRRDERFESVIVVGGNTRTPKVQQVLMDYFNLKSLGKSINADEGAALAALYQAASLGRGFRVKKFGLEEFGEERVRFDPAKVIVTTTTPAPTTEEPSTASPATEPSKADEGTTTENKTTTLDPTTTTTTTVAPVVVTTPDPDAIYNELELERISRKLVKMRQDDFTRLQELQEANKRELDEIENERKKLEKESGVNQGDEGTPEAADSSATDEVKELKEEL